LEAVILAVPASQLTSVRSAALGLFIGIPLMAAMDALAVKDNFRFETDRHWGNLLKTAFQLSASISSAQVLHAAQSDCELIFSLLPSGLGTCHTLKSLAG
jgi:hypothetical protein